MAGDAQPLSVRWVVESATVSDLCDVVGFGPLLTAVLASPACGAPDLSAPFPFACPVDLHCVL